MDDDPKPIASSKYSIDEPFHLKFQNDMDFEFNNGVDSEGSNEF